MITFVFIIQDSLPKIATCSTKTSSAFKLDASKQTQQQSSTLGFVYCLLRINGFRLEDFQGTVQILLVS